MRSSRRPLVVLAATVAVIALLTAAATVRDTGRRDKVGLYSLGLGVLPDGTLTNIPVGSTVAYLPGSRVIRPGVEASAEEREAAEGLARESRRWLASGSVPGGNGPYGDMVTDALLDLHALTVDGGAALAGNSRNWRYVWPRDASFVIAALGATGHTEDAMEILDFLAGVQHADGTFEARYLPDGSGPPDDRGLQSDGSGWVLWAVDYLLGTLPPTLEGRELRSAILERYRPLIERSTAFLLSEVDGPDALPTPSADYWEHRERRLTLGTAAPLLAGLESAARLYTDLGLADHADEATAGADLLRTAVVSAFGSSGYGRYPGRSARDAATAFLLPPFQPEALPGAEGAWRASLVEMARPAGGLAPGAAWPEQSISWTPQTSLYAWSAAVNADTEQAHELLSWIDSHRTSLGAISEKVGPGGDAAGVAPLSWSCAVVILTVAELDRSAD